jgi:hypothetical protein
MAACGREGGPYATAVALTAEAEADRVEPTAAPEAERIDPRPTGAQRWIRPIGDYERRVTSEIHGARYG